MSAPATASRPSSCCSSAAFEFVEGAAFYFLALALLLVCLCSRARYPVRSQFGLVLAGMRQNEERLAFFGYRVQVFKALIFSLRRHDRRPVRRALQLSPGLHRPGQHGPGPVDHGGASTACSAAPAR